MPLSVSPVKAMLGAAAVPEPNSLDVIFAVFGIVTSPSAAI